MVAGNRDWICEVEVALNVVPPDLTKGAVCRNTVQEVCSLTLGVEDLVLVYSEFIDCTQLFVA